MPSFRAVFALAILAQAIIVGAFPARNALRVSTTVRPDSEPTVRATSLPSSAFTLKEDLGGYPSGEGPRVLVATAAPQVPTGGMVQILSSSA
ncbi:hypothetical protein C2E23DRAFT_815104 [Lenzites betulinus]|nr:hypothetical protein C2E23DRAFT_815104 [Lenzites betulinus]